MLENIGIHKYIYSKLSGHAPLTALVGTRIYSEAVPGGAVFPLVVFSYYSGLDQKNVGVDKRLFSRQRYIIKAISKATSYAEAGSVAHALDNAINAAAAAVIAEGGINLSVQSMGRSEPVQLAEREGDLRYNHLGGIYEFWSQEV